MRSWPYSGRQDVRARTSSWQPLSSQRRSRCTNLRDASGQAQTPLLTSKGPQPQSSACLRMPLPLVSTAVLLPRASTVWPAMHSDL